MAKVISASTVRGFRERFRAQADAMPNFDEYQSKTTRQIPVIVLARV